MQPILKVQMTWWGFSTNIPCCNEQSNQILNEEKIDGNEWKLSLKALENNKKDVIFIILIGKNKGKTCNPEYQLLEIHQNQNLLAKPDQGSSYRISLRTHNEN